METKIIGMPTKKKNFTDRVKDFGDSLIDGSQALTEWAWNNKSALIGISAAITAVAAEGRRIYDRVEKKRRDREIYDPSLHKNVKLRKKITPAQVREINRLRDAGYDYHDIYQMMGLVK